MDKLVTNKEPMLKVKSITNKVFKVGTEGGASIVGEIVGGIIGNFVPGLTNIIFSYRQNRLENNLAMLMKEFEVRQQDFDNRLRDMKYEQLNEFKKAMELVFDYVPEEAEAEKIKYMVNGLVELAEYKNIHEEFVLLFYDTLKEMRLLDLRVLMLYHTAGMTTRNSINLEKIGISQEQNEFIANKLLRMGLLSTNFEDNVEDLYRSIDDINNTLKGNSMRARAISIKPFKYEFVSSFGVQFIDFFCKNKTV
ncbi:hypothetical protein [Ectobacillus antri]|uniref:hypothetical protein n=1 Tax=Ectobacillus antri TaxID=2486280 RepID=UPI000F5ACC91|nr:hypothetical protein [Ectobacillus antri]